MIRSFMGVRAAASRAAAPSVSSLSPPSFSLHLRMTLGVRHQQLPSGSHGSLAAGEVLCLLPCVSAVVLSVCCLSRCSPVAPIARQPRRRPELHRRRLRCRDRRVLTRAVRCLPPHRPSVLPLLAFGPRPPVHSSRAPTRRFAASPRSFSTLSFHHPLFTTLSLIVVMSLDTLLTMNLSHSLRSL